MERGIPQIEYFLMCSRGTAQKVSQDPTTSCKLLQKAAFFIHPVMLSSIYSFVLSVSGLCNLMYGLALDYRIREMKFKKSISINV